MFFHRIRGGRGKRGGPVGRVGAEPLEARVLLSYSLSTLASFNGANGDDLVSGLVMDGSGNFFGTAKDGGAHGSGDIYELAKGSGTVTVLVSFNTVSGSGDNATGATPFGGLVIDSAGNLYGTTDAGGADGDGTVFELVKGSSTITVVAPFDSTDQANCLAGLVMDGSGNLFGTTSQGGNFGSIFEVAKGSTSITPLASFPANTTAGPGILPEAGLVMDADGNLFGTTNAGGSANAGTVFELAKGSSTITTVASFNGASTGNDCVSGLIIDGGGDLFGTTSAGGINAIGNVFEIKNGSHSITVLGSFNTSNGLDPVAGLVMDGVGNLYGTASDGGVGGAGVVFEITAASIDSGHPAISDLVSFTGVGNIGTGPMAGLLIDGSGDLFSTTNEGGTANDGTIFKVTASTPPAPVLVDVDFTVGNSAAQTGAATLGSGGDVWNNVNSSLGFGAAESGADTALNAVNGGSSGVELSYAADNSTTGVGPFASTAWQDLMQAYLIANHPAGNTVTLSDLTPNGQYDLFLYSGANTSATGRQTSLTVNGDTQTTAFNGTLGSLANGVNYASFLVTATSGGVVAVTFAPGGGGGEGDLNGLQLQTHSSASTPLALTTPATAASVNAGGSYGIQWSGGNPTDTVQIWAEGGPNNAWTELTPGIGVPQNQGQFAWNTAGVLHGWYYFQADVIPIGGTTYDVVSPNYLHVIVAAAQAPNVALTNPPLSTAAVVQGNMYTLDWTASDGSGDTNPIYVQLWVSSGNTGLWTELPGANYLPAGQGSYAWDTTGMAPGWYSFAIHATNGDQWSYAASPGWLNVTLASAPVFNYTTPTADQSVAAGSVFSLDWTVTGVPAGDVSAMTVQVWAQYLNGSTPVWAEVTASVNAATGAYGWNTTGVSPHYYAFNVYLGYGDEYFAFASPNWLDVT